MKSSKNVKVAGAFDMWRNAPVLKYRYENLGAVENHVRMASFSHVFFKFQPRATIFFAGKRENVEMVKFNFRCGKEFEVE